MTTPGLYRSGSVLLDQLLRDIWEQRFVPADAPDNPMGNLLISAELCSSARKSLRAYEDFTALLGVAT